jgi:uncharacterized protein (DUF3084 family)
MDSAMITAIGAAAVAVIGGVVGIINSNRANRPAEMNAQLAWVKSAQDDAASARTEAKAAKDEAAAARQEADATYRQSVALRRDFEAIQDWVDRVVRVCEAYRNDMAAEGHEIEDSGVLRIIRVVNGGPHLEPR